MSVSDVAKLLANRRQCLGRSARDVSLAAKLSESVVGKVETGVMEPSLRVFSAIACELALSDREIALLVRLAAQDGTPPRERESLDDPTPGSPTRPPDR